MLLLSQCMTPKHMTTAARRKAERASVMSPLPMLCWLFTGQAIACRDTERSVLKGSERRQGTAARRYRSRSRSRDRSSRGGDSPYSRGTDTEDGEVKEPSSPMRAGPLSARQHARVADLSLLLDVILKTNYYKCGTSLHCSAVA